MPSTLLRWLPSLVGVFAFAAMAVLFGVDHARYLALLRLVGIHPWAYPFIDGGFMFAMKRCWLAGVDVYRSVPCDVVPHNKMAYSPLWQRLPFLATSDSARVPVGVATDLLLLLSLGLLPAARTAGEAAVMALAVPSTMVCFALERNNIDVWVYLVIFAGGLLLSWARGPRLAGYAVFTAAGLLKYYPFALFGLAFTETPRRCLAILAAAAGAVLLFWLAFQAELREEFANIPAGSPFTDMVGIVNLPIAVGDLSRDSLHLGARLAAALQSGCRLALTLAVVLAGLRLARRPGFDTAFAQLPAADRIWLVLGCLVMGGCYLMGQNVGYRGIYLLIVLAGLVALRRAATVARLRDELGTAMLVVLLVLWMEALRHGIDLALSAAAAGNDTRHAVRGLAWAMRELLWLDLERVMLAVLVQHFRQAATIMALTRAAPPRS